MDDFPPVTYVWSVDAWVVVGVCSREAEQFIIRGNSCTIPADFDLLAGGIELGFALLIRQVESNDFVSDQVLSWSEIIRKGSIGNCSIHYG